MNKDIQISLGSPTPVIIGRRFRLKDLFIYRITRHGLCIVKGVVEGYSDQLSMVEWIDFFIDDKQLMRHVSYLEKRILSNLYGVKPTPFLYITLSFPDCGKYKDMFRNIDHIRITTSQWFSWYPRLLYGYGRIYDFLNTFCKVLPSTYKPPFYSLKYPRVSPNIIYYNFYSSIRYRMINIYPPSLENSRDKDIIYPPNIFGVGGDQRDYLYILHKDVSELESDDHVVRKYRMLVSRFNNVVNKIIFPIFKVYKDSVKVGFIVREGSKIDFYTPVYEGEYYVIDQSRKYSSSRKFTIFFKDFWSRITKKGYSLQINIIFEEFKYSPSRMYPELHYGGRIYYSASSIQGYKIL